MKIAITGANGFVGHTLLNHFYDAGHEAIALIRPTASISSDKHPVRMVDYDDPQAISSALSGVDILVHNAGKTKSLDHLEMMKVNVGLTRKLVEAINLQDHQIRLLYISSQAASSPAKSGSRSIEADPPLPITAYGKSKALAEKLIRSQCKQQYCIVRPCSIYGPGDRDFLQLFKLCKAGISMQIGKQQRLLNMIHVKQLGDFLLRVIDNPQAWGQIFFATDNQEYTQQNIVECICQAMGKSPRTFIIPEALARMVFIGGDILGRVRGQAGVMNIEKMKEIMAEGWLADPAKARNILNWEPESRLPELIAETYQWYVQASWL